MQKKSESGLYILSEGPEFVVFDFFCCGLMAFAFWLWCLHNIQLFCFISEKKERRGILWAHCGHAMLQIFWFISVGKKIPKRQHNCKHFIILISFNYHRFFMLHKTKYMWFKSFGLLYEKYWCFRPWLWRQNAKISLTG